MGQGPEELRRDIERRREDLGETLDAIGDRVSPGRIIERRRNRVVDGVRSVKDRVMGTVSAGTDRVGGAAGSVRDHLDPEVVKEQTAGAPIGAGLITFGVGFLVAAIMPATEPEVRAAQRVEDHLGPAREALQQAGTSVAQDLKQDVAAAADSVKETATNAASNVADEAKQQAAATTQEARTIKS